MTSSSSGISNATAAAHQGEFPLLNCFQTSDGNSTHGDEDWLDLDIYLPLDIKEGRFLPMVISIYGGGFQSSDPRYPSELISKYENVIYVAIPYRLDIFSFMA